MTLMTLIEILKLVGGIAGALTTIIAFFTLISKKPKAWLAKTIREESKAANQQLEKDIKLLVQDNEESKKRDIVSIRHSITTIYEEYKSRKKFPVHVKEDLLSLFEEYDKLGGNSYVHTIIEEMKQWDTE